ncbi:MAG TPA: lysophospholipid acyltransferase family protein [Chitinophagaceae bacterium]|nr:lysophospholipid acyltransferase family protein [Chitinophagaceae bacterium]
MNFLKDIFARFFAIWALLLFVITLLIVFIPIAIAWLWKDPARSRIFHRISQVWMAFYLPLAGVWVRRKGKQYFEKGRTYIVICNHNSLLDVPLTTPGIPSANKTIAKIEMAGIPVFGLIYKTGSVLVNRSNEESRRASFNEMKAVLQMGLHMCIYPEGTRNRTGAPLRPFHSGAFRLAADTGYEILPAVLFHTAKVLRNDRKFYFWPGVVEMHFLPSIPTAGQSPDQLRDRAFSLMKEYYEQHAQ